MTKLTDLQSLLLASGAQRDSRSLLPPPEAIGAMSERIRKAVASLIKRDLAREIEAADAMPAWREDGDLRFGAVITDSGMVAIGIEPEAAAGNEGAGMGAAPPESPAAEAIADHATPTTPLLPPLSPARPTKAALVLELLQRAQGATLTELVAATGWLPHTTRAALTGLRKKGHAIAKSKRDETTCYSIAAGEAA